MTTSQALECVVLDANVWIKENLLHSAIGHALIYAMTKREAIFGLPEIVEREINNGLNKLFQQRLTRLENDIRFLSEISRLSINSPTLPQGRIDEVISHRWLELRGTIRKIPLDHTHTSAALEKILLGLPPCTDNNEQFRDCCLWEAVKELAAETRVHLITADTAFFESRAPNNGPAPNLLKEANNCAKSISICADIPELLSRWGEEKNISENQRDMERNIIDAILDETIPKNTMGLKIPRLLRNCRIEFHAIKGFATPEIATLAISFDARYEETDFANAQIDGSRRAGILKGICSFDMKNKSVSRIDLRSLSEFALLPKDARTMHDLQLRGSVRQEFEDWNI